MSKTQISGNRIRKKSLSADHLSDDVKIPESMLALMHPTHGHYNKDMLDKLRYSGVKDTFDLRDLELIMLEVIGSRKDGYSLGSTIDGKADKNDLSAISTELSVARGTHTTLDEAIKAYGIFIENGLQAHIGSTGHHELDKMFNDYTSAKQGSASLTDRLNQLGTGTGTGGTTTVNILNPWRFKYTITNDSTKEANRTIVMPYSYTTDTNAIEVFENALLMEAGSDKDYIEVDSNTIQFNYDLPTGTIINITGIHGGTLYQWKQTFRAVEGQQNFALIDTYVLGSNDLVVYESGLLMTKGEDYEESGTSAIKFKSPLPVNSQVTVYRRR